jgi:hypothetical protein
VEGDVRRIFDNSIAGVTELVHNSGRGADQVLAAAAELSRQAAA